MSSQMTIPEIMAVERSPASAWDDVSSFNGLSSQKGGTSCHRIPLKDLDDTLNAALDEGSSTIPCTCSSNNSSSNSFGMWTDLSQSEECLKDTTVSHQNGTPPRARERQAGRNPGNRDGQGHRGVSENAHVGEAMGEIEISNVHGEDCVQDLGAITTGSGSEHLQPDDGLPQPDTDAWRINNDFGEDFSTGGGDSVEGDKVTGFHDIICLGFAVALCLNLGSMTARQKGFFAVEVKCLPSGAVTTLEDLGVWVGWRRVVANSHEQRSFDLEELSKSGAIMGILTIVGHSAALLVNAVGFMTLLCTRRKRVKEGQSRAIKISCLAALGTALWLLGITVIGFLIVVDGPIGSAAVVFYSQEFPNLDCESSVAVSVDYAYAMTALTILCQFFIGIVALPRPPRWCPPCSKRKAAACSPTGTSTADEASPRRGSSSYVDPQDNGMGTEGQSFPDLGVQGVPVVERKTVVPRRVGLEQDTLRDNAVCDPV